MVEHPDYPELNGLAQVIHDSIANMVYLKFCDDGSEFFGNAKYIRAAEFYEVEAFKKNNN